VHPCAQCARLQRTCCERAEVVVTDGDIRRIEAFTRRTGFWEFRAPTNPQYTDQPDDPNWVRYTMERDGTRRVLRRLDSGACLFLGDRGCTLPTEVRPLVCRLYPYDYTETEIKGMDDSYCPVDRLIPAEQRAAGVTMLTILGMRMEDAERWRRMLYEELKARAERKEQASCASA